MNVVGFELGMGGQVDMSWEGREEVNKGIFQQPPGYKDTDLGANKET